MNTYWFKRGTAGWQWYPATWEGWSVTGFFLAVMLLIATTFDARDSLIEMLGLLAVPALLWLAVVYMTGSSQQERDRSGEEDRNPFQ